MQQQPTAADISAAVAQMAETAKDWDTETFAAKTVYLLILNDGNLNRYQRTLELVFQVHEAVIAARQTYLLEDTPTDTVDALVQAEAFIEGFEDDATQEGIADILAGLRAAIQRERVRPDLLAEVKEFRRTVAFYIDKEKSTGDDEGTRLKRIKLVMLDDLIASAERVDARTVDERMVDEFEAAASKADKQSAEAKRQRERVYLADKAKARGH